MSTLLDVKQNVKRDTKQVTKGDIGNGAMIPEPTDCQQANLHSDRFRPGRTPTEKGFPLRFLRFDYQAHIEELSEPTIETVPVFHMGWGDMALWVFGYHNQALEIAFQRWYHLMKNTGGTFGEVRHGTELEYRGQYGVAFSPKHIEASNALGKRYFWVVEKGGRYPTRRPLVPDEVRRRMGLHNPGLPRALPAKALTCDTDGFMAYQFCVAISDIDYPISHGDLGERTRVSPYRQGQLLKMVAPLRADGNRYAGEVNMLYRPIPNDRWTQHSLQEYGHWQLREDQEALARRTCNSYISLHCPLVSIDPLTGKASIVPETAGYVSPRFFPSVKAARAREPYRDGQGYAVWDRHTTLTKQGGKLTPEQSQSERALLLAHIWRQGD